MTLHLRDYHLTLAATERMNCIISQKYYWRMKRTLLFTGYPWKTARIQPPNEFNTFKGYGRKVHTGHTAFFLEVPWVQKPWCFTLTKPQASVHSWPDCNPFNVQYPKKYQQTSNASTTEECLFSLLRTPRRTGMKPRQHGELLLQIQIYVVILVKEKACNTLKEKRWQFLVWKDQGYLSTLESSPRRSFFSFVRSPCARKALMTPA